jgi:glycyl-tRNA synthetase beta chain
MGGYYARAERLPVADAVADAIRDHYKPVGQGDEVPTAPVTVAVSLADKLDTLVCFFAIDERPTGSKDPLALRRAAMGILNLLQANGLRLHLDALSEPHLALLAKQITQAAFPELGSGDIANAIHEAWSDGRPFGFLEEGAPYIRNPDGGRTLYASQLDKIARLAIGTHNRLVRQDLDLVPFFADRLKVQQREAGVRHDLIDAVFALGGEDDLVRLLARVHALQAFVGTEDGANLLAGYKRAANILKKEDWQGVEGEVAATGEEDPLSGVDDPDLAAVIAAKMADRREAQASYATEPAEQALIDALAAAAPRAEQAVAAEDFAGAMAALASLRAPIDAFFDAVMINDADPAKRRARLQLLDQFRAAVHNVADFSRIEG